MRRSTVALALALLAAVSLAGCGDSTSSTSSTSGPIPVKIATAPIADYAPVYLGVEQGFFEDEGLDVEFTPGRVGTETISSVLSGHTQFAGVAVPPLLVAQSQNLGVSVLTPSSVVPGDGDKSSIQLLASPKSNISSMTDLNGATIAVNALKAQLELMTRIAIANGGGDPDSVTFVEVPFPEMPAALARGDVDAVAAVEPFLSSARGNGAVSIADLDRALPEGPITAFFTSPRYAASDPEVVEAFKAAMDKSLAYAAAHPEAVRAIIPKYSEIPADAAAAIVLPTYSQGLDREGVVETFDAMQEHGLISDKPNIDKMLENAS